MCSTRVETFLQWEIGYFIAIMKKKLRTIILFLFITIMVFPECAIERERVGLAYVVETGPRHIICISFFPNLSF